MTRNEEDQILLEEGHGRKTRGRPKKATHVLPKDIQAAIPVDRHSLAQRLAYGYSLMALDGESYE
jgi:hypothetical protein